MFFQHFRNRQKKNEEGVGWHDLDRSSKGEKAREAAVMESCWRSGEGILLATDQSRVQPERPARRKSPRPLSQAMVESHRSSLSSIYRTYVSRMGEGGWQRTFSLRPQDRLFLIPSANHSRDEQEEKWCTWSPCRPTHRIQPWMRSTHKTPPSHWSQWMFFVAPVK